MEEVTFRDIATLAKSKKWTITFLVERCQGLEDPKRFFEDVFSGKNPETVIPYRSVLELYYAATLPHTVKVPFKDAGLSYVVTADPLALMCPETVTVSLTNVRLCPCGCGQGLAKRQRYATSACGRRLRRQVQTLSVTKRAA